MSILETFYILFKSDASEVKKGADEAKRSTLELESSLKNVGQFSEKAGQSFLNLAKSASGVIGAFVSAGAIFGGLRNAVNSVQELGNISRELNVNVETLDAWGHAVQRTGGTAQGFQSSLRSLADHLNTTAAVALKSLPAIADSFAKLNPAQANRYGKSLGLDQATIYLLQQGRREVQATIEQQKELGLVTQKDVEVTRKFDNALYDLGRVFQSFSREAALPALPYLQKGFEYLIEHKDLIKGALIAITGAVAAMGIAFGIANPAIAAVALSLAAFSLAYEDYQKFKAGAPSVIGYLKDDFQALQDRIGGYIPKSVKGAYSTAKGYVSDQALKGYASHLHLPKFLGGQGYGGGSTNTLTVGDVTIQTNATDGQEVAGSFSTWLNQLWQSNSHFDNGVSI